jgi:hypothetical protein
MVSARRILAGAAIVAVLGSCTTYQGSKRVAKVGGVMLLAGTVSTAATLIAMEAGDGGGMGWLPIIAIGAIPAVVGLDLTVAGLIGMAANKPDSDPRSERRTGDEPTGVRSDSAASSVDASVDESAAEPAY